MVYIYIGEENCNPLQYSCLENSMDRRAWQATVHGVTRVRHYLETKHHHVYIYTYIWTPCSIHSYVHMLLYMYVELGIFICFLYKQHYIMNCFINCFLFQMTICIRRSFCDGICGYPILFHYCTMLHRMDVLYFI